MYRDGNNDSMVASQDDQPKKLICLSHISFQTSKVCQLFFGNEGIHDLFTEGVARSE